MLKLSFLLIVISFASYVSAQCNNAEDANNTPTICTRGGAPIYTEGGKTNAVLIKETEKWMTSIFNTVADPAIKKTKGLRGTWTGLVEANTPEGLTPYSLYTYLSELGCRNKKLYEIDESGVILTIRVNSLKGVASLSKYTEYKTVNNQATEQEVIETVNGKAVYELQASTETETYSDYAYYRKDKGEQHLIVGKPGIPLFLPVSIKDVLLLQRNENLILQNMMIKQYDDILRVSFDDYLKQVDFASIEKNFSKAEAEKMKASFKETYDSGQKEAKKGRENKSLQPLIDKIDSYLKTASAAQLAKPCIGFRGIATLGSAPITNAMFLDNPTDGTQYVTINPAYTDNKTATAPHFIIVETRLNAPSGVSLTQKKVLENSFDYKKLEGMVAK